MIKSHIYGLSGPAGCGKDTVADLLATHANFTKFAFADPLRFEICEGFGVTLDKLLNRETKSEPMECFALARCLDYAFIGRVLAQLPGKADIDECLQAPRSPRQILQWWGTAYRRASDERYWTRALVNRVAMAQKNGQRRFVITDVRFENEADSVREVLGGEIWQIKRPGVRADRSHVSEVDGSEFAPSVVINNMHDIRHLQFVVLAEFFSAEVSLPKDAFISAGEALRKASTV